jgi:hypothetical protein
VKWIAGRIDRRLCSAIRCASRSQSGGLRGQTTQESCFQGAGFVALQSGRYHGERWSAHVMSDTPHNGHHVQNP